MRVDAVGCGWMQLDVRKKLHWIFFMTRLEVSDRCTVVIGKISIISIRIRFEDSGKLLASNIFVGHGHAFVSTY